MFKYLNAYMNLVEVNKSNKDEYNSFVLNNETGSFLQSYEWGEWQKNLGRLAYRFFLTNNNNNLASIQLIKMPLPFGKYYLYVPYGPVEDKSQELRSKSQEFLTEGIKQKFPDAIFLKIEPQSSLQLTAYSLQLIKSFNIQPAKTLIINLTQTEQQLLAQMHPKTRYNIRLAQKHGVKIQKDLVITPGYGLYFTEVVDQISQTEKRQNFVGHGKEYYKKFLNFFALQNQTSTIKVSVYKALYEKKLLASAIMVDFGVTRTYLFGGSSEENKNLMAPYLLHFKAMLDAKENGTKFYDFWGLENSSGKSAGFAKFKVGFGGGQFQYAGAYDFPIQKLNYKVLNLAKKLKKLF